MTQSATAVVGLISQYIIRIVFLKHKLTEMVRLCLSIRLFLGIPMKTEILGNHF